MLKSSHWSRYVEGTLVNKKNVVGNFVICTGTNHGGLKHVSYKYYHGNEATSSIVFNPSYMSIFHHQIVRIALL